MARSPETSQAEPEYVTDWRAVYAAIGVLTMMIVGSICYAFNPPAEMVRIAKSSDSDESVNDLPREIASGERSDQLRTIDVVLPWAPLPVKQQSQVEVLEVASAEDKHAIASADSKDAMPGQIAFANVVPIAEEVEVATSVPDFFVELDRVVTLDFNATKSNQSVRNHRRTVQAEAQPSAETLTHEEHYAQFVKRADLVGLPILRDTACTKTPEEVKTLALLSKKVALINAKRGTHQSNFTSLSQETPLEDEIFKLIERSKLDATSVAPLVQILQVQTFGIRMMLVGALASIDGPEASRALADRALFDSSDDVRSAAIEELKYRDQQEYGPRLLVGFRYPWAPAAYHAATAVIALRYTDALPILQESVDKPDPCEPFPDNDGNWHKSELVRVNHLRNCLLCHPRSVSRTDPLRGAVPTPGRPLPRSYRATTSAAVRADITYLRQDFSIMQPVADRGPWPAMQRFDFLVRTRPMTPEEVESHGKSTSESSGDSRTYPQREAVLLAIKGLSELES